MTTNKEKKYISIDRETLWCLPVLAVLAVAAILMISARYSRTLLPRTEVAGVNCASLSAGDAAAAIRQAAEERTLTLSDGDGTVLGQIPLSAFLPEGAAEAAAEQASESQHTEGKALSFDWIGARPTAYPAGLFEALTPEQTAAVLEEVLYAETPRQEPVSASVELTESGYRVVPEEKGNSVELELCAAAVTEALQSTERLSDEAVSVSGALHRPGRSADGAIVRHQTGILDKYLGTQVAFDFGNGNVIVLTPEDIASVSDISVTDISASCAPNAEKAAAFTAALAEQYADDGVYAKFRNAAQTRELIYYRVGDKGWILDKDALAAELCAALESAEDTIITPRYDYTWYWKDYYWYYYPGDTFVEISLDNQYLWYFVDGELLVETPVVTGNIANQDYTNRGFFRITSMTADTWLVGPTWYDHVDYWMPFDDQIGLHDSSWRSEYGGDIYLTDGSHGCINTPLEAVGTIYNNIRVGIPVIVY